MERKNVVLGLMAAVVVLSLSSFAGAQEKGGAGPYGLPTIAEVKAKVMPTDDEMKKLEEVYAAAAKAEAETRQRAKDNQTDGKTLKGYIDMGRIEYVNKIKEVLDKDKAKLFDQLLASQQPAKKKK
jgi:hypothetical protein